MLTLYHSPESRSSAILTLIEEMGIADWITLHQVTIPRMDGSGGRDPANPHPEGKVPALVQDGTIITERAAIMLVLTTMFPDSSLAPAVGTPEWGAFVTWLTWYQGVMEPVVILQGAEISHPWLSATFHGPDEVAARLRAALQKGPWLMGDRFTAADILLHSPYAWFPAATPDDPLIRDWVERCKARPARQRVLRSRRGAARGLTS
ncbi:MAG: glutathione S-transferase family protein, partial [Rhodobacteraceae bacterium]|nr:glutathione S-transferase family protein [Paracoccaceae bacterium]